MFEYIDEIKRIIEVVEKDESENIKEAVELLTNTILKNKSIYVFGASHAGIISEEMYYRAGGLVLVNPIFGKEINLSVEPITLTSKMERLDGYGSVLAGMIDFEEDDVLILHSVSGRNPVTIELGLRAKEKGTKLLVLTNLTYSKNIISRDKTGKRLYEIGDIVLDNHGRIGDASVQIEEGLTVGPTSTVIGATIVNTIISEVAKKLKNKKIGVLPFFYSANIDGGDDKNKLVVEKYRNQIKYRFN